MNKSFFAISIILIISCNTSTDINYPLTEKKIMVDTYFGTDIEDHIGGLKMIFRQIPWTG